MAKEIPVIYTQASFEYNPEYEIFSGEKEPHAETIDRVRRIFDALKESGFAQINTTLINGMPWIEQVHTSPYLDFLRRNSESSFPIYPSVHPYLPTNKAVNPVAERGLYMFDTYTPITKGVYEAAVDSASCAVAGAKLLLEGEPKVYSLTRPPGHHAEKAMMGGYCYINNAAVAAKYLRGQGAEKVAIFDFDLHHGNGTQDIFYDDPNVLFVSIHASPDIKFPYYTGYSDETGAGKGEGANYNFPLPEGVDDERYHQEVEKALKIIYEYCPNFLLISAGFDTHVSDPIGAFRLSTEYYRMLGESIAKLDLPALTVQEGGYATDTLGANVVSYLKGLIGI